MPKSQNGKAIVRLNGVQHGMRSILPVIKTEDAGEWEQHRQGILQSLAPWGALETALAERIASLLWRLQRVTHFETAVVLAEQQDAITDYAENEKIAVSYHRNTLASYGCPTEYLPSTTVHPEDLRGEVAYHTSLAGLLSSLPTLPDDTELGEAGISVLCSVAHAARVDSRRFLDDDAESKMCTAGIVRQQVDAIAAEVGEDAGELLAKATEEARRGAKGARYKLKQALVKVARMEQRRMLPEADDLERILRYEAHMNRQLMHSLRELEAIQRRREGEALPLARVDVCLTDEQNR